MKKIFEQIYQNKVWYGGSGLGSLPKNTIEYRNFLQRYIADNNIRKVIDIGCGNWSFSKLLDWTGIEYLGIDVVDFVIAENKRNYQTSNIKFKCGDVRALKLPKADLVILKDVLQHWSNQEINNFLPRLKAFKHILITDDWNNGASNKDIQNGSARPLALEKEPFNLKVEEVLRYQSFRMRGKIGETKSVKKLIF